VSKEAHSESLLIEEVLKTAVLLMPQVLANNIIVPRRKNECVKSEVFGEPLRK
jgi:hypothetical protein